MIRDVLQTRGIPLEDCEGYDNGANMSGKMKHVQANILKLNPSALYPLCAAHTLNLVGVHAAQSSTEVAAFFWLSKSSLQLLQCQSRAMGSSKKLDCHFIVPRTLDGVSKLSL